MQRGDEQEMTLAPRLGWLFGLAPLPARPAQAAVRAVRCLSAEDLGDDAETSSHDRARDRRRKIVAFLKEQGRECTTREVASAGMVTDPEAHNDLQALMAAGRVTKRVERVRGKLDRVFWGVRR